MTKKRQLDFQTTKLRVGKRRPKGKNVTDTSFKTKKIVVPEQLKETPPPPLLPEFLSLLGRNDTASKKEALNKIQQFVLEMPNITTLHFSGILKKVGETSLHADPDLRKGAIGILSVCIQRFSETQINLFFIPLTSYLNSMMTHLMNSIRRDSLLLLDKMLHFHPSVVCRSIKILYSLLNMISSVIHVHNSVNTNRKKRKLDEIISSSYSSQDWRASVLYRIQIFFQAMIAAETPDEMSEDEREVYWDGKKPLYLPLYVRTGPTPAKLESLNYGKVLDNIDSEEVMNFIYDLVPLLSEVLIGEVCSVRSQTPGMCEVLSISVIKRLNVTAQLLCSMAEWMQMNMKTPLSKKDEAFSNLLSTIIGKELMKGFPYIQDVTPEVQNSESECMLLNLVICYLLSILIMGTPFSSHGIGKSVFAYLDDVFLTSYRMCSKSIILTLKISKSLMPQKDIETSYKNGILMGLYGIIECHKDSASFVTRESTRLIKVYFMELSLDRNFRYLLDTEGMITWNKLLIKELLCMTRTGRVDKKFLKYVQQICIRKCPYFMQMLNKIDLADMLGLLKYNDEDFQQTIVHLIKSITRLSSNFLQDVAETLQDDTFSVKTACRMIRLLHLRFSASNVSEMDKLIFLKFLLNLGCGTSILMAASEKKDTELFPQFLRDGMQICRYDFVVPRSWQNHLEISEVCLECLPTYIQNITYQRYAYSFMKDILMDNSKLPIHTAMVLLKLRNRVEYIYQDEDMLILLGEIMLSVLFYISIITDQVSASDLSYYAIPELQHHLNLGRHDMDELLHVIEMNLTNGGLGENEFYHILRIFVFLVRKDLLSVHDSTVVSSMLEKIHRTEFLQPFWITVCGYFNINWQSIT